MKCLRALTSDRRCGAASGMLPGAFTAALLLAVLAAAPATADCNLIPSAIREFRSTQGFVGRTIAAPGERVRVRVDLACDPDSPGFSTASQSHQVTLRFEPPGSDTDPMLVTEVAANSASFAVENCGPNRCDTLSFIVPDTNGMAGPGPGWRGLTGPATIEVKAADHTPLAEIGPLREDTDSCDAADQVPEAVFGRFIVLPPHNDFGQLAQALTPEVLGTLDGNGNLLIPFDFSDTLPTTPGSAVFRVLEGRADLAAGVGPDPMAPIRPPGARFLRSFSADGRPIPPILEVDAAGELLFGTVDAAIAVLRIARKDPDDPVASPLYDLDDRLVAGKGPLVIDDGVDLDVRNTAPLASLTPSPRALAFTRDEAAEGTDLNADGDQLDRLVEIVAIDTAAASFTAQAVEEVAKPAQSPRPALAASGDYVAYLESEARQGVDRNGELDKSDSILRVFTADGIDLTRFDAGGAPLPAPLDVDADPTPVLEGRALSISGDYVFFRSREGDSATRVEEATSREAGGGAAPMARSGFRTLSADGRFAALASEETWIPGDANGAYDVFVWDRDLDSLTPISVDQNGDTGPDESNFPSISADGRYVSYTASAGLCAPQRTICVRDRQAGVDHVVALIDSSTALSTISGDGRFVGFSTSTPGLLPEDSNAVSDVYVYDLVGLTLERVSKTEGGLDGNSDSYMGAISDDGRFVYFSSDATNLVPSVDDNGVRDLFVVDRVENRIERISQGPDGTAGDDASFIQPHSITSDGRFVTFWSRASNLLSPGQDTNGESDVYVFDRLTRSMERISHRFDGSETDDFSVAPTISRDGRFVAFDSVADLLVPGDNNGVRDVFLYDRVTRTTEWLTEGSSDFIRGATPFVSPDGRAVSYHAFPFSLVESEVIFEGIAGGPGLNTADTDQSDSVLQVFDATTQSLLPGARVSAQEVHVAGERALILTSEAEEGGSVLNADGDADDVVAQLYDPASDTVTSLQTEAAAASLSDSLACLVTPAGALVAWVPGDPIPPPATGAPADLTTAAAGRCIFRSPEALAGDLNGDGDSDDAVLQIFTHTGALIANVGHAAEDFVVTGDLVAFRSCESDQGNLAAPGFNLDGDVEDCVMFAYEISTATLTSTGRAASLCTFPGCDPFFEPYSIVGRTISFVTREADQSGPSLAPGCLATPVAGECDLNGDGDALDTVVQVYSLDSGKAQVFAVSEEAPPEETSPFPMQVLGKTVLAVQAPESSLGNEDLDGDGAVTDELVLVVVGDVDADGTLDGSLSEVDNCVEAENPDQADSDLDQLGDDCDPEDATPQLPGELPCDVDTNLVIDSNDIDLIFGDRGMQTPGSDPRDPDDDGLVTVLDAGFCAGQCTNPDCAPQPPPLPGGGCGLLGIEVLPVVGLAAWSRKRREQRASGS